LANKGNRHYLEIMTSTSASTSTNTIPPISIEAIIFDLDGTLLDTEVLSDKAILLSFPTLSNTIFQSFAPSYQIPWELKQQLLGLRGSEWAPIVLEYAHQHWDISIQDLPTINELWSTWELKLNELCSKDVQPCRGAAELVHELSTHYRTIPLAIATSSRTESYAKKRKCIELNQQQQQLNSTSTSMFDCMSVIVTGDHPAVIHGKPAPDIYYEAARQLNVNPRNCLVFEDALSGIRAAKAAGCYVVAIPDERFDESQKEIFHQEADIVINSLWEFTGQSVGLPDIDMPSLLVSSLKSQQ
jgi:pseudouridine 5'-phosphatase